MKKFNNIIMSKEFKNIMKKFKNINIINLLLLLPMIFFIFYFPTTIQSYKNTYIEKLDIFYGYVNSFKIPLFLIIITIISFINIKIYKKIKSRLFFILIIVMIYIIFFYIIPTHCPFNLSFNKKNKDTINQQFINLFAIGDIQNDYGTKIQKNITGFKKRMKATRLYINAINEIVNKKSNFDLTSLNNSDKKLFNKILNNNFNGMINPGDCAQYNSDGRFFTGNNIGAYEYGFNHHGKTISIPTFECLGNHDYDMNSPNNKKLTFYHKIIYSLKNPAKAMMKRKNKTRNTIINKDKYGNYSCDFNNLHIIFINVWPTKENITLLSGKPEGSINFLKNDLKIHGHKKWMLVTHFIPFTHNFNQDILFNDNGILTKKPILKSFGNIVDNYKNNCIGFFYGHNHIKNMISKKSNTGFIFNNLPGPAYYFKTKKNYDIELPLLSFDTKSQQLYIFLITKKENYNTYYVKKNIVY